MLAQRQMVLITVYCYPAVCKAEKKRVRAEHIYRTVVKEVKACKHVHVQPDYAVPCPTASVEHAAVVSW
jgi:hypothetical protein